MQSGYMTRDTLARMPEGIEAAVELNYSKGVDELLVAKCAQLMLPNTRVKVPVPKRAKKRSELVEKVAEFYKVSYKRAEQIILLLGEKKLKREFGIK